MQKTILFIDGENFLAKMREVLKERRTHAKLHCYDFAGLFDKVLAGVGVERKIFYLARLKEHPETREKSKQLIEAQRLLKTHLEKQGFEIIIAGRVRGFEEKGADGKKVLVFKEKGIDVRIAVDMVSFACDRKLKTAIIGSSDSDLQPAISELAGRNVERVYLGFESMPNKGMSYTANRTILIRNSEVMEFAGN